MMGALINFKKIFNKEFRCVAALNARWNFYKIKKIFDGGKKCENDIFYVVSLTSYPRRYKDLARTIKSILMQKTRNKYEVILWIAKNDIDELPNDVVNLCKFGLKINSCEDLRSYKKIVPLAEIIAAGDICPVGVIIADDDMNYPQGWLNSLIEDNVLYPADVVAHRVHRIKYLSNGFPDDYMNWIHSISESGIDSGNFATGCGGVLYPTVLLKRMNFNINVIRDTCPDGDDIWLYAETRKLNSVVRLATKKIDIFEWSAAQSSALWLENCIQGRNNQQIKKYWEVCGGWNKR
ncbi:hypothetical protein ABIC99_002488 [Sphaerotilus sulfidivorans]|uniref:Glycosyltransferase n=1 Tax=Sphaerotilus sulfidivorans TaxID=639200 RepID=A0A5C1Q1S7_9BURK|nr:hypothetical protein EWH46_12215 [Sphaerotilus sulfidivorans]